MSFLNKEDGPFAQLYKLSPPELYDKAIAYEQLNDFDNYIIYMTMAANLNYDLAKRYLYDDYMFKQTHLKQNYAVTVQFYNDTFEYGYSANYLGLIYSDNYFENIKQNYELAIKMLQIAIKQGNIFAINNLAWMYDKGKGVKQDYYVAIELYERAIKEDELNSIINLANIYANTESPIHNYALARKYYELAVCKNKPDALNRLIKFYKTNGTYAKEQQEYIIKYFLRMNKSDALKQIYNYDDFIINILKEHYSCPNNNKVDVVENFIN